MVRPFVLVVSAATGGGGEEQCHRALDEQSGAPSTCVVWLHARVFNSVQLIIHVFDLLGRSLRRFNQIRMSAHWRVMPACCAVFVFE